MNRQQIAFIESIKLKLQQPLPGLEVQMLMAPPVRGKIDLPSPTSKIGAVMIVLVPRETTFDILLIRRTADRSVHSNQISLPGGKQDDNDYTTLYTALRETEEEVGLKEVSILGALTHLYIPPSDFLVFPYVCFVNDIQDLVLSQNEVQEVLWLDINKLNKKEYRQVLKSDDKNLAMQVNTYTIDSNNFIWGATAMILRELEEIIVK